MGTLLVIVQESPVLFEDTFDNLDAWTIIRGTPSVSNNQLNLTGPCFMVLASPPSLPSVYTIGFDVVTYSPPNSQDWQLMLSAEHDNNGLTEPTWTDGEWLDIYPERGLNPDKWRLQERNNNTWVVRADSDYEVTPHGGESWRWVIDRVAKTADLYVDGYLVNSGTFAGSNGVTVGLRVGNATNAVVKNYRVFRGSVPMGGVDVLPAGYFGYTVAAAHSGPGEMAYLDDSYYSADYIDFDGKDFRQHVKDEGGGSSPSQIPYRIWRAATEVYNQNPAGNMHYPDDPNPWRFRLVTSALASPLQVGDFLTVAFGDTAPITPPWTVHGTYRYQRETTGGYQDGRFRIWNNNQIGMRYNDLDSQDFLPMAGVDVQRVRVERVSDGLLLFDRPVRRVVHDVPGLWVHIMTQNADIPAVASGTVCRLILYGEA